MPKFARFDPTKDPAPVMGWYDMDNLEYPNPPPENALFEMTDEQWVTRQTGKWVISRGKLLSET